MDVFDKKVGCRLRNAECRRGPVRDLVDKSGDIKLLETQKH
ncbi:MAG: hypothetical protein U5N26_06155 [Candidatus Marinimicrobia bacterium]|nr:hypothetical protein [Candidatus Neomarinimicrobiota bacterium]